MSQTEFFQTLHSATTLADAENALITFLGQNPTNQWVPVGNRDNNRGTIDSSSDPGRSLIERLTNGIDAVLEDEFIQHNGIPDCRSPKEAATAWLNVPAIGLSDMTTTERRTLAQRVTVKLLNGEGRSSRVVEVRDYGTGLTAEEMPRTILSLNESNKMQKHHLAGAYGQGGSSTFASSALVMIASRAENEGKTSFTVVRYEDLPANLFKIGRYVYLTLEGSVLEADIPEEQFGKGTLAKHFGYDLTNYPSPLGPNSLYGLMNTTLFDPVLPIWLDASDVHQYRRVIKGSRNALNGAVDDGDENARGPQLSHNVRMFYTTLGEFGRIGIEYWVLERPSNSNKKPSAAYVNPAKPIILTVNGQNQDEFTQLLIRKSAELPYLTQRLICHVDCNNLTPQAKRQLFVSNRETGRQGVVRDLIQQEIIKVLKSDDELARLNAEARDHGREEQDEQAMKRIQSEVAKLLSIQGVNAIIGNAGQVAGEIGGSGRPTHPPRPRPIPHSIELADPPTYIKILWDEDKPIAFYPEQRRYVRIETDAISSYHQADGNNSRLNVIITGNGVRFRGTTPLNGGRMRVIAEADADAALQSEGAVRVELSRPGLPTLSDERTFEIVEAPPAKPSATNVTFPPFEIIAVEGPNDERWNDLGWPDNINDIASWATMEEGILRIYYSSVFPKFAAQFVALERRDTSLGESFRKRYEIWLIVHSLLYHQDQQAKAEESEVSESASDQEREDKTEREERIRIAMLSSLFAARELQHPEAQFLDVEGV